MSSPLCSIIKGSERLSIFVRIIWELFLFKLKLTIALQVINFSFATSTLASTSPRKKAPSSSNETRTPISGILPRPNFKPVCKYEKVSSDSDRSFRPLCFEVSGISVPSSLATPARKAHLSSARATCSGYDLFRPRICATYTNYSTWMLLTNEALTPGKKGASESLMPCSLKKEDLNKGSRKEETSLPENRKNIFFKLNVLLTNDVLQHHWSSHYVKRLSSRECFAPWLTCQLKAFS